MYDQTSSQGGARGDSPPAAASAPVANRQTNPRKPYSAGPLGWTPAMPPAAAPPGGQGRRHTRGPSRGGSVGGMRPAPVRLTLRSLLRPALAVAALLLLSTLLLLFLSPSTDPEDLDTEQHLDAPPSKAFCIKARPTMICAHGGDSTSAPPNSADAFRAAVHASVDCVEVDVARTFDNQLVVLHVRELQQLLHMAPAPLAQQLRAQARAQQPLLGNGTDAPLQVGDLTLAQLSGLSWQPGGQRVLSVKEAILLTSPNVEFVTLDVKTYADPRLGTATDEEVMSDLLLRLVHETRCTNCLVWAKSDRVVQLVKGLSPGQRAGYIVINETEALRKEGMHLPLRMQEPEVVGMHHAMVDSYHLELLHGAGKQLHTWTINEVGLMRRMLDVGVDAIVTNFPKMGLQAVERRLEQCARHEMDL